MVISSFVKNYFAFLDFVPPNSASDAAILAQIGLQSISRQTLGSQLPSAIHSVTEMNDDLTTSR